VCHAHFELRYLIRGDYNMIGFTEVYAALQQGKHVRQRRWDKGSEMFVQNGELMYSCRGGAPKVASSDLLDWRDMNRTDWTTI
jgi:hypothetical protein